MTERVSEEVLRYWAEYADAPVTEGAERIAGKMDCELLAIREQALQQGYTEINDLIGEHEKDPRKKAALDSARDRLRDQRADTVSVPTFEMKEADRAKMASFAHPVPTTAQAGMVFEAMISAPRQPEPAEDEEITQWEKDLLLATSIGLAFMTVHFREPANMSPYQKARLDELWALHRKCTKAFDAAGMAQEGKATER